MLKILESLSKMTTNSKAKPMPKEKNLIPALRVIKISRVEIILAVVSFSPSFVKCMMVKQAMADHTAVEIPNDLSRLLAKLSHS